MSSVNTSNLVSVIVVGENTDTLHGAISSVLTQTHTALEIILVDNSGCPRMADEIKSLTGQDERIRSAKHSPGSLGAAFESGRLNVRGEFVQYLRCHERLSSDKLALQLGYFRHVQDLDVVLGSTPIIETHRNEPSGVAARLSPLPFLLHSRAWTAATPLYRRNATDKAGPWMDVSYAADWEYQCRFGAMGMRIKFIEDEFLDKSAVSTVCNLVTIDSIRSNTDEVLSAQNYRDLSLASAKVLTHAKHMQQAETLNALSEEDWTLLSDTMFSNALACALRGYKTDARAFLNLSVACLARKSPRQRLFIKLIAWLGWRKAAKLVVKTGRRSNAES